METYQAMCNQSYACWWPSTVGARTSAGRAITTLGSRIYIPYIYPIPYIYGIGPLRVKMIRKNRNSRQRSKVDCGHFKTYWYILNTRTSLRIYLTDFTKVILSIPKGCTDLHSNHTLKTLLSPNHPDVYDKWVLTICSLRFMGSFAVLYFNSIEYICAQCFVHYGIYRQVFIVWLDYSSGIEYRK